MANASMPFYRDLDPNCCQGDVVDGIPSLHLKAPLAALQRRTFAGGSEGWEAIPLLNNLGPPGTKFDFKTGEQISAFCQISRAIVLSYDCDIDHDRKHCLVALIRPLAPLPAEQRAIIQANRNFSYFYLPAEDERNLAEAYVDFRRITCLSPEVLDQGTRLASLNEGSVAALQAQFIRFLTRRELV